MEVDFNETVAQGKQPYDFNNIDIQKAVDEMPAGEATPTDFWISEEEQQWYDQNNTQDEEIRLMGFATGGLTPQEDDGAIWVILICVVPWILIIFGACLVVGW